MPEGARAWTALAFDFGLKRIGVATADSITRTARPLGALQCGATGVPWDEIVKALREWQPTILVAGIPYNADGSPGALTETVRQFARDLAERFALPVASVDERWSSLEANARLRQARQSGLRKRRVSREDIDAGAACVILERWLESGTEHEPTIEPGKQTPGKQTEA